VPPQASWQRFQARQVGCKVAPAWLQKGRQLAGVAQIRKPLVDGEAGLDGGDLE
jgi:hypothetical protein